MFGKNKPTDEEEGATENRSGAFEGPTCMYGPNGQSAIFNHPQEVPEGWVDNPNDLEDGPNPKGDAGNRNAGGQQSVGQFALPPRDEVDKTWIEAQLKERNISFNKRWDEAKLYDLLADSIEGA